MTRTRVTTLERRTTKKELTTTMAFTAFLATAFLGGCVNVSAPDKPIEINLNINVKQEVVYRLDNQAKTAIQANPGIF